MRLFENIENASVPKLLETDHIHKDRSPIAAAFKVIISDDVFAFLSRLESSAADDVFLFRNGVACSKNVYFDGISGHFHWDKVRRMHTAEGVTLYVRGLQRHFNEVKAQLNELAPLFSGKKLFANLFLSPGNAVGLNAHFDPTDFLVFQLAGSKLWRIWNAPITSEGDAMMPDRAAAYCADVERSTHPRIEHRLVPGDVLFLRQYTIHAPRTTDEPSIHITVGIAEPKLRERLEKWADA